METLGCTCLHSGCEPGSSLSRLQPEPWVFNETVTFGSLHTRVFQLNTTQNQMLSHPDRMLWSPGNHSPASTPVVTHRPLPHAALVGSHNRPEQIETTVPMLSPSDILISTYSHIYSHARPTSSGSHPESNLHTVNAHTALSTPPPAYPNENP